MRVHNTKWKQAGWVGLIVLFLLLAAGCASSSHVVLGTVREPIDVDQVKVYLSPPQNYEEIALLESSSGGSLGGGQGKLDAAVEQLKEQAAALGANGVLLRSSSDRTSASVGTGTGVGRRMGSFGTGLGLGVSVPVSSTSVSGVAIYVIEE